MTGVRQGLRDRGIARTILGGLVGLLWVAIATAAGTETAVPAAPASKTSCITIPPRSAMPETVEGLRDLVAQLMRRVEELEQKVEAGQAASGAMPPGAQGSESSHAARETAVLSHGVLDADIDDAAGHWEDFKLEFGRKGLILATGDGSYRIQFQGLGQFDGRFPLSDDIDSGADSTFLLRRLRAGVTGKLGGLLDFQMQMELAGTARALDMWGDVPLGESFRFRFGLFKSPLGLEFKVPARDLWFVERSLAYNLIPTRDLGVQLHGSFLGGALAGDIALMNGVNDGRDGRTNLDTNEGFDVEGMLVVRPFHNLKEHPLQDLGFGVAASWGTEDGPVDSAGGGNVRYQTAGRDTLFTFESSGTTFDGDRIRYNPGIYYFHGPLGLLAEYVHSSQDLVRDGALRTVESQAWMAEALWVLTGEDARFGDVVPAHPVRLGGGRGWGMWSLAARYSALDVGDAAFEGDSDSRLAAEGSAGEANAWAINLSWQPVPDIRWMLTFEQTFFDGDAGWRGDRQTENVLQTRFQFGF